jgi:carbon storage regulator
LSAVRSGAGPFDKPHASPYDYQYRWSNARRPPRAIAEQGATVVLIMTRKIGQTVVIGDNIEVTVVQVQLGQNQVRLGVNAPRDISVFRKELVQEITRENVRAAAAPAPEALPTDLTPPEPPAEG